MKKKIKNWLLAVLVCAGYVVASNMDWSDGMLAQEKKTWCQQVMGAEYIQESDCE